MTKDEINKVFDFLEQEFNKLKLFYFKLTDRDIIGAYFTSDETLFAEFSLDRISQYLKDKEAKDEN